MTFSVAYTIINVNFSLYVLPTTSYPFLLALMHTLGVSVGDKYVGPVGYVMTCVPVQRTSISPVAQGKDRVVTQFL